MAASLFVPFAEVSTLAISLTSLCLLCRNCARVDRWITEVAGLAKYTAAHTADQNQKWRPLWVCSMAVTLFAFAISSSDGIDCSLIAYALVALPTAHSTRETRSLNWLNQGVQTACLAFRLWDWNTSACSNLLPELFCVGSLFVWNELTLSSFSTLLSSHLVTNLLLWALCGFGPFWPAFSMVAVSVFCFRRKSAWMSDPVSNQQACISALNTQKCVQLVRLMLEGAEEIREDSLHELLGLLTNSVPPKPGWLLEEESELGSAVESHSQLGVGVGTGGDEQEFFQGPSPMQGRISFSQPPTSRWRPAEDPTQQPVPTRNMLAHCPPNAPGFQNIPRPQHSPQPYIEELASLSFDAMAQVGQSGTVVWANKTFMDLVSMLGRGNTQNGLKSLQDMFLCDVSRTVKLSYGVVGLELSRSMELCSATQMVGPEDHAIVLWVIHQSNLEPSSNTAPPRELEVPVNASVPGTVVHLASSSVQPAVIYPHASDYPYPLTKVYGEPEVVEGASGILGLSQPSVLMLWHKYGKKSIRSADGRAMSRSYFKCYRGDCKARLRVDTPEDAAQAEAAEKHQGFISASGKHNHSIVVFGASA